MNSWLKVKKEDARRICLSMYVGCECEFCNHKFESVEDIEKREVVCAGKNKDGLKFACKKCFDAKGEKDDGKN